MSNDKAIKKYSIWPNILMIITAILLIVGMALPWMQIGSLTTSAFEQTFADKWTLLLCAIATIIFSLVSIFVKKRGLHIFTGVIGLLAGIVSIAVIVLIIVGASMTSFSGDLSYGIYVSLVAAVLMMVSSVLSFIFKKK